MENKKGTFRINVEKGQEFRPIITTDTRKLSTISEYISNLFGTIYKDFVGCTAMVGQQNKVNISLYFGINENKTGKVRAFDLNQSKAPDKNDAYQLLRFIQNVNTPKQVFEMTSEGKEGLAKYIPGMNPETAAKANWSGFIKEIPTQDQFGKNTTLVSVSGLDIEKILVDVFRKADEGTYQYELVPTTPLATIPQLGIGNKTVDWIVEIRRLGLQNLTDACSECGINLSPSSGISGLVKSTVE